MRRCVRVCDGGEEESGKVLRDYRGQGSMGELMLGDSGDWTGSSTG